MTAIQHNMQSVTMTVERALLVRAREAGINLSATLTAALDAELRHHEAKKWQEENREAIDALNRFHDEHGCFSDEYRTFYSCGLPYANTGKSALYPLLLDVTSDIFG